MLTEPSEYCENWSKAQQERKKLADWCLGLPVDDYGELMSRTEDHVFRHCDIRQRSGCHDCRRHQHDALHARWLLNVGNHLRRLHFNHSQTRGIWSQCSQKLLHFSLLQVHWVNVVRRHQNRHCSTVTKRRLFASISFSQTARFTIFTSDLWLFTFCSTQFSQSILRWLS